MLSICSHDSDPIMNYFFHARNCQKQKIALFNRLSTSTTTGMLLYYHINFGSRNKRVCVDKYELLAMPNNDDNDTKCVLLRICV